MMYVLTEQEHAQIVDALESVYGKGKRCDSALAVLKAMRPVEHIAELMWDEEKKKSYMQYTMPIGLLPEGSKLYAKEQQ